MKYLIKGTALKFNHKVYEIGDEITLTDVPESITHLLEPIKEVLARRSTGRVIPESSYRESKKPVIPVSLKPESKKSVKKTKGRNKK